MRIGHGLMAAAMIAAGIFLSNIARAQPTTEPTAPAISASPVVIPPDLLPPPMPDLGREPESPSPAEIPPARPTETTEPGPSTQPIRHFVPGRPWTASSEGDSADEDSTANKLTATQPSEAALARQPATQPAKLRTVVVTSDLDQQRDQIAPALGATTYTIGQSQINTIPGGENATFQQVLLQAPSVVMDSFGQEHVRGEHANLTYRVNGVILPEGLNGFGQELDTRLIDSVTLIDGALPAQFGWHTAGIVDVTTKSGAALNGGEVSFYGGSYDTFNPSVQFGGTHGNWDYYLSTSYKQSNDGIENPASTFRPIHDETDQERLFGYFSYHIDDTSRLSFIFNASNGDFEIPNLANQPQVFTLANHPSYSSADLNETQNEQDYYNVVSYQKTLDQLSFQASVFSRYGQINYLPDPVGDLIFQGVATHVFNSFLTNGVQFDSSYVLNDQHTIRAGLLADYESENLGTTTQVFPVNPITGLQSSTTPTTIDDTSGNEATTAGVYVQDEWKLTDKLTMNYGARFDWFDANFDNENQLSPRINFVYKVAEPTTLHVGYARYFTPPPLQNLGSSSVDKFAGTTNAPTNFLTDPAKVEKADYYDAGVSQQLTPNWNVDVDGFYKYAHNLVDLGQFGTAFILSPFNYRVGTVYGTDISSTYKAGGMSLFGNFAWVETNARDIDSQQFQIDNAELDYIADHDIHLDHESEYTASTGISYAWPRDMVYADVLYGSGLRTGFANTLSEEPYFPVNVGYQHLFYPGGPHGNVVKLRVDVVNLFDQIYQIRNASGIGVNASQYGQRRSVFMGIAYDF